MKIFKKIKFTLILCIACLYSYNVVYATLSLKEQEIFKIRSFINKHDANNEFIKLLDNWTINFFAGTLFSVFEIEEKVSDSDREDALSLALWHRWDNESARSGVLKESQDYTNNYQAKKKLIKSQTNTLLEMGIFK